jgi:outer membrane protein
MSAKLRRFSLAVMLAAGATVAGLPTHGADQPLVQPVTVLVVDMQRVLQESKAGKMIQSQMQQQVSTYQKTLAKQDQELAATQQDLQRQQSILAQDAFAVKVKEFEQHVKDASKRAQEAQQTLSESRNEAVGKVDTAMLQVIDGLAKERGANLIVNRGAVVMFDVRMDVSDEVIKRLDEKLPAVTVSFNRPASGAPGGAAPAAVAAPAVAPAAGATPAKPGTPAKKKPVAQ